MKKLIAGAIALLVMACPAFATTLFFEGFEAGSNGSYATSGGALSWQQGTVLSGGTSLEVSNTSSAVKYIAYTKMSANGNQQSTSTGIGATTYVKFDFQYHTKPVTTPIEFAGCYSGAINASNDMLLLKLTNAGRIALFDSTGSVIEAAGPQTVLSADTKYKIEMRCSDGAAGAYEVRINGVQEEAGTANQGAAGFVGAVTFGQGVAEAAEVVDFFYDDVVINDSVYTSYPKITALYAIANGGTAQWTAGTNASNYAEVDDPTGTGDADTTYIKNAGAGGGETHLVSFQSTTTGNITGAIGGVSLLVNLREDVSVTSASYARLRSASTNSDTTPTNKSTAGVYFQTVLIATTDPATGSAWTSGGVDAVQGGVVEDNAVSDRCTRILIQVMWDGLLPPTATPTPTITPTATPWPTLTPLWARNVGGNQIGGHKITRKGSIWR